MTLRVAVLGCGPAGMLAAHAAARQGAHVDMFSIKAIPSPTGGAQYLHRQIPGITRNDPDAILRVVKVGTQEGYAEKVYGDPTHETSWSQFDGYLDAWNLREAYAKLWTVYGNNIQLVELNNGQAESICRYYHYTFSAIPAKALCKNAHHLFVNQPVFIHQGEAWGNWQNVIEYNGQPDVNFYRASMIFGIGSVEYPEHAKNVPEEAIRVQKPLWTDCTCCDHFQNFYPVGRYGQWRKGVLTHHAYELVKRVMA